MATNVSHLAFKEGAIKIGFHLVADRIGFSRGMCFALSIATGLEKSQPVELPSRASSRALRWLRAPSGRLTSVARERRFRSVVES